METQFATEIIDINTYHIFFAFFTFLLFQLWLEAQKQQISASEKFEEARGYFSSPTRFFVDIVQVSADFIGHLLKRGFAVSTKFLLHQLQDDVTNDLNREKGRNCVKFPP